MKQLQIFILASLALNTGLAQNETIVESDQKLHFATIDTVQRESGTIVYEGVFNLDFANGLYQYDNSHQYWFSVAEAKIKEAFNTILEVELSSPENGVYEKMGVINCQEVHAPSTKKDVLNEGLFVDAWGFNLNIEVWYNGSFIKLVYPALGKNKIKSLEHAFYIKAADYKKILKAFTPNKK